MSAELISLTATQVVAKLRTRELSPLDLIDATAARISEVEPSINALPTLCLDRARDHAKRLLTKGDRTDGAHQPGWLGGIPVAIKDLTDVEGVRTTYGSPLFKDHVPAASHAVVQRIEQNGGIVVAKSNTPEFGAGGTTFNEVFGRTLNPWNTSLTSGGSTGGGAAAVATGEVWFAQGTDHGGSLRRPAAYCSVVGIRCSPGRITRGTPNSLWSPLVVQGPIARNVADLALMLDAMCGPCRHDPLTVDAPTVAFSAAVKVPTAPRRIAFTPDFAGKVPVDRETRELCARMARRFEEFGCIVEEASPDIGDSAEMFITLRAQHMLIEREYLLNAHRALLKKDLVWNIEKGQQQATSKLAWAERERAAFYRRMVAFFDTYDLLLTPAAATPAFDATLRHPARVDGVVQDNYMSASLINSAITLTSLPAMSVPCGFDSFGRPVGLQLVGRMRAEAQLLQAAALFEQLTGLNQLLPVLPRAGTVPPLQSSGA